MKEKSRDFFKKLHLSLRIDEKTEPPSPNKSHNGTVTSMSPLPILKNRYASQNKSFKVNQKSIGSISASKNWVNDYLDNKSTIPDPYKPTRKFKKHELSAQTTPFDMFADETIQDYRKADRKWKDTHLKEKILWKGGLDPNTFKDNNGNQVFNKENRVSLLLFSQNPTLKKKFKSENLKKLMDSKHIKKQEYLQPAKHFNEKSYKDMLIDNLSPETAKMDNIAHSSKFRASPQKFLRDLDELVALNQDDSLNKIYQSGDNNPYMSPSRAGAMANNKDYKWGKKADGKTKVKQKKNLYRFLDTGFGSNNSTLEPLKVTNTEDEKIPYLQYRPFHIKYSNQGKLGEVEKEIYSEIVKLKTSHLKSQSNNAFKKQKVDVSAFV